ncbi:hypothetical protein [Acinetobacter pittii]
MNFSFWFELLYPIFMAIVFAIWFTLKFIRELRWKQEDDQYIP